MFKDIEAQGLVLLGCGKMGSALLQGWLANGLPVRSVYIIDPNPSDWVKELMGQGLNVNLPLPAAPAIVLIAVKPQMMG
ncbi:MAG TPA: pyrroline-5-carboxylate reductase, partial [Rhodobacter sp.]|nr:pyrroline-5-carboxylate reductase [Rhodobacter sp.]